MERPGDYNRGIVSGFTEAKSMALATMCQPCRETFSEQPTRDDIKIHGACLRAAKLAAAFEHKAEEVLRG